MKRLLAYLFIVLGLGLVFSTASFAAASLCIYKSGKYVHFVQQSHKKSCSGYVLTKKMNIKLFNRIRWHAYHKGSSNNYGEPWSINREENHFNNTIEDIFWFISINHDDPEWENFFRNISSGHTI